MQPVQAVAAVNDWAVTPEWALRPVTPRSKWVVTHIPTGLKTGVAMTQLQALATVNALRSVTVPADTTHTDGATRLALWLAHPAPVRARWHPHWLPLPHAD